MQLSKLQSASGQKTQSLYKINRYCIIHNMNTANYKNKLIEEQNILQDELSAIAAFDAETNMWHARPSEQTAPEADENDMADRSENFEERSAEVDTLGARYRDIQDALLKIGSESYGTCETCGEKIEEERLEANPAARTCMGCMNK